MKKLLTNLIEFIWQGMLSICLTYCVSVISEIDTNWGLIGVLVCTFQLGLLWIKGINVLTIAVEVLINSMPYKKEIVKEDYLELAKIEVDNYIGTYEKGGRGLCLHYPQQEKELEPLLFNNVITPENNLADHLHYIRTDKGPISLIGMPKKIKRR